MKKLLFIAAAALLIGTTAQAQDVYKQQGGEKNIEFLFAPLGASPIGINGIKYRTFTDANTALRATVFLGFSSETDVTVAGEEELNDVMSEFNISIAPGIEKHFAGTDKLSPYYGGELLIGFARESARSEFLGGTDNSVQESTTRNGSLTLGLNGICGVDYYFADNIYIGGELGFGVAFTNEFDTVTETDGADDTEVPNGNSFNIGPNVVGQIRAGFLF
jgi:opacity protein-like surface antigen